MISRLEGYKPNTKKMSRVNLDALLRREYMYVPEDKLIKYGEKRNEDFKINELEISNFFFTSLKKPDFQRETSDWTPDKICDFIESFINGDLIPSIIMWYSGQYCFVIDGAHRISALLAWVNNDYGNGSLSRPYFNNEIDPAINKLAERTKALVNKKIGPYQDYKNSINNPLVDPKIRDLAIRMGSMSIKLQWVPGDAETAEKSFFKINESATPINEIEKALLKARKKPNAIAARAIIHSGGGHKFWERFSQPNMHKIEVLAKELNAALFLPQYDTPINTMELPIAGKGYSNQSLELIYNLVNLSNDFHIEDKSHKKQTSIDTQLDDDSDGSKTVEFLEKTKKSLSYISGKTPNSLGLHPAIYFYSDTGRHQFTSLMAWIEVLKYMELHKSFKKFTLIRRKFEDFFIQYKIIINQVITKQGSGVKGYRKLYRLYKFIIEEFQNGQTETDIINKLKNDNEFYFLNPEEIEVDPSKQVKFSSETKSMIYFKHAFPNPQICGFCDGYYIGKSSTADHIEKIREGGIGHVNNGRPVHPYCNSINN